MNNYVPYAKAKKDKNGHEVYLQTMKVNGEWVIDIFEDNKYIGRDDRNFPRLIDAGRYIDSAIQEI